MADINISEEAGIGPIIARQLNGVADAIDCLKLEVERERHILTVNLTNAERRAEAAEAEAAKWKKLAGELARAAAPLALQDPDYDGMWNGPCTLCHHDYRRAADALNAYEAQVKKGKETK